MFQLRKSKEAFSVLRGRSSSLPRRGGGGSGRKTGKRLPALPPIARKATDAAKADFTNGATTGRCDNQGTNKTGSLSLSFRAPIADPLLSFLPPCLLPGQSDSGA